MPWTKALGGAPLSWRDVGRATLEVRRGSGLPGLQALRPDWESLTRQVRETRFYHRYAWQLAYLAHLERDPQSLHVYSVHRHGRTVAIFPLRRALRMVAGIGLRVWELPCPAHMDLCDTPMACDEDNAALLAELVRALARQPDMPWDALYLPKLLDGAIALRALQAVPLSFVGLEPTGQSMHFDCRSLEHALCDANPHFIRNLRRQRRNLDRCGRTEVSLVREAGYLEAALDEFLRIEASGWKRDKGSAILLSHRIENFYRDLTLEFGAEGRCSINLLRLDGNPIAAQYALIDDRRMNLLKIAYDETWAPHAPGSRLLHEVLARCCESDDIDELSLVTGPTWAPGRWNPQCRNVWSGYVFNATPRGMAAHLALRTKRLLAVARTAKAQRNAAT